jgi:predicted methyltransferase
MFLRGASDSSKKRWARTLMQTRDENSASSEEASNGGHAAGALQVLSFVQARALLAARESEKERLNVSFDLGRTEQEVKLQPGGVEGASGLVISWADLEHIAETESVCFLIEDDGVQALRAFSEGSGRVFQLMPTDAEPLLLIAGFAMHRFRDVGPALGAKKMVEALSPLRGRVLDTTTGLGYAAIHAARFASEVVTIEIDPMAREIARKNPWSRELFESPRITRLLGDSSEVIKTLPDDSFSAVLHDPPAINLAGELYSQDFYSEVYRVLSRSGKFFHYIGDPKSASGGRVTKGVLRRLGDAGFSRVVPKPQAFGVLAMK